jgi:hypothetical protein
LAATIPRQKIRAARLLTARPKDATSKAEDLTEHPLDQFARAERKFGLRTICGRDRPAWPRRLKFVRCEKCHSGQAEADVKKRDGLAERFLMQ